MRKKHLSPLNKLRVQLLLSLWYDMLKLNDLPDTVLAEARKYMFFDKRIKTRFDHLDDKNTKTVEIIEEETQDGGILCPIKNPKYLDALTVYFQKYADGIVDKLYKYSPDILGERPDFIFKIDFGVKEKTPAELNAASYPFQIEFSLQELGRYVLEDSFAFILAHELVHLAINRDIPVPKMKQEEAMADILGTLVITRAGYHPGGAIICQGNWNTDIDRFFDVIDNENVPLNNNLPGGIRALYELKQLGLLKRPFEINKHDKKILDAYPIVHPTGVTRTAYLIAFTKYLESLNLTPENCRPMDKKLMALVDARFHKKPSAYKKHVSRKVINKINRRNQAFAKQIGE